MSSRIFSGMMLSFLLIGMLTLAISIQPVRAQGTITINADGSISPSTAPIYSADNITYTSTGNITADVDGIVVERDNIVLNGAGYTVQGTGASYSEGIDLTGRSNVTIGNMNITAFFYGVYLNFSSNNSINGNNLTNSYFGICLDSSPNNSVSGNNITNDVDGVYLDYSPNNSVSGNDISNEVAGIYHNVHGIYLYSSSNSNVSGNNMTENSWDGIRLEGSNNNSISGNNLTNNGIGITIYGSSDNKICHNNFINNQYQVSSAGSINTWDYGYPSGGNYWSDYNGTDVKNGSYQNETGNDGIGDTPYTIAANNSDDYPLMGTLYSFTIFAFSPESNMSLTIISNSSVTNPFFVYGIPPFWSVEGPELPLLVFSVNGGSGAVCFCRLLLPKAFFLNSSTYIVFVDAQPINATVLTPTLNSTQAYLYFTYTNSTHQVVVTVPEFSSILILPLFTTTTLLTVIIYKKKGVKTSRS